MMSKQLENSLAFLRSYMARSLTLATWIAHVIPEVSSRAIAFVADLFELCEVCVDHTNSLLRENFILSTGNFYKIKIYTND